MTILEQHQVKTKIIKNQQETLTSLFDTLDYLNNWIFYGSEKIEYKQNRKLKKYDLELWYNSDDNSWLINISSVIDNFKSSIRDVEILHNFIAKNIEKGDNVVVTQESPRDITELFCIINKSLYFYNSFFINYFNKKKDKKSNYQKLIDYILDNLCENKEIKKWSDMVEI